MPALMTPAGRAILFGARTYAQKVLATAPANLLAYWPLWEASGSVASDISGNGRNGAYTGVDLGSPGIGDGRTSPFFDSVNDYCNIYSAGLSGAFNVAEGTAAIWLKVASTGVWTDGSQRRALAVRTDVNNQIFIDRNGNNALICGYTANAQSKSVSIGSQTSIGWLHLAISWSKTADQVKVYLNGTQQGATQTALGVWAGALSTTNVVIGAISTTPTLDWSGYLAHAALWSTPLTAAQIAALAVVS